MLGHRTLNVEDYVAIVRRRWPLLLLPTLIFPLIAYAITFAIDPQFVSQTLVLIDRQQVPTDYVRPVVNQDLDTRLASMQQQILSRTSLQPIIDKYALYSTKKMNMDEKVEATRKAIEIKAIHSDIAQSNGLPGFIIAFRASDAHTAQSVCGEITGLFVKQSLLNRAAAVGETTDFLNGQLADAKRKLDDQDSKIAAFQRQYFGKLPGDENTNVNVLATLNSQLTASNQQMETLQQNRAVLENLLAQQAQTSTASVVATRTSQAHEKEMQDLLAREADLSTHYTPENPDVKAIHRQIEELQNKMAKEESAPAPPPSPNAGPSRTDSPAVQELRARIKGIDMAIQSEQKQRAQLDAQVGAYRSRVESSPQVEEQYKELTRDYDQANDQYQLLLKQISQAKTATDLEKRQQGEQFRIMDEPNLPDAPAYPKKPIFLIGGLVLGLAIGVLATALLEYKNTALRSERDIWAFTQLPTLAVIAWSGEVAHIKPGRMQRVKRLLRPKRRKDQLIDANA